MEPLRRPYKHLVHVRSAEEGRDDKKYPKEKVMEMKSKIGAISAILIAMFVAIPLVRVQGQKPYAFTLMGPNVSKAAVPIPGTHVKAGDFIRITGAATFDITTGAVNGGGAWAHVNFDGTAHGEGIWIASKFVNFTSYGGPSPDQQGGLLNFIFNATSTWSVHWAETGPEKFIFMSQVSSAVNAPPGAPVEGVTIWAPNGLMRVFGIVVSGRTLLTTATTLTVTTTRTSPVTSIMTLTTTMIGAGTEIASAIGGALTGAVIVWVGYAIQRRKKTP